MKPVLICTVTILLGLVIVARLGYAIELSSSEYTLNQVVQLALQHNPVMSGAEADRKSVV